MRPQRLQSLGTFAALSLVVLLGACTQKNTADQQDQAAAAAAADVALGVNRFLLFPNPIGTDPLALNGGTFETNTTAYAQAYYDAIDPPDVNGNRAKDTIDKWRAVNGFNGFAATPRPGTEHLAVFRDVRDLGYGRRMTGRRNSDDGSIAFYVENYNVAPNGSPGYASDLNVDAAIRRDTQWHVGTNAIEWTSTPCIPSYDPADCDNTGTVKFAKYYNFSSADGTRQLTVDLDGHGKKAMPGVCITCHGGRGDPLTPPDQTTGSPRFPLVENLPSRKRGDVGAHLHGQNVDSFTYSTTQPGFAKSDMQPFLADFNQWILCTYPSPTPGATVASSAAGTPWGSCVRPTAGLNEWQGTAAEMIQSWYGGPSMPGPFSDTYVPAGWISATTVAGTTFAPIDLYKNVVALYCRTCHVLRGTKNQDDINFFNYGTAAAGVNPATGFLSYADRIKVMVFDRGNMPLAEIPHQDFWGSSAPQMLATFVDSQLGAGTATASNGAPLMPGRSIADPGPDRMVRTGANAVLTGENSLFASTFSWTNVSGPSNPLITNPSGMVAIFNASVAGTYVVNLSVNGGASSKNVTITVDDNFPDPLNIKFAQVKNVLQNVLHKGTTKCVDCHKNVAPPLPATTPPIWYTNFDRDGSGGIADATDEAWFLKALQGRVNLTEISASPLLRKPTGNHHNAGNVIDTTDTTSSGGLRNYSVLYNWILAGMQPGGVAANPVVNGGASPVTLTFSGVPPFSPTIPVDGSTSLGTPTSFLWSVSGPSGPTGAVPSFASPTLATTTFNVPNVGTYLVQLQVSDGTASDVVRRSLVVTETAVAADFVPGAVGVTTPVSVSFSGNPLSGAVNLASTSTGSPATCSWQVTGPAGPTLDGAAIPVTLTKSCGVPAALNVPSANIGSTYAVTLTAISTLGVNSAAVVHSLQIQSAGSGVVANAGADSTTTVTFTNPVSVVPAGVTSAVSAPSASGIPAGTVALNGSASTGPGTLTYSWTVTASPGPATGTNGSYAPTISNPTSVNATLNVHRAGLYTVQLVVSNGLPPGPSNTDTRNITVVVPAADHFGATGNPSTSVGVAGIFQINGQACTGCHDGTNATPSWIDSGSPTLFTRVVTNGFTNSTDPTRSLILTCPSESTKGVDCLNTATVMTQRNGFVDSDPSSYNIILNWIIGGALNN